MIVCGIDSSTHSGISILDSTQNVLFSKVYNVRKQGILGIKDMVEKVKIVCVKYRVTHIAIESISWGSPNKNILDLLATINVLFRSALIDIAPIYLIAPLTMKKFVTGKGKATKKEISVALKRTWKLWNKNQNIRDSIGIALCGLHYLKDDVGPFNYSLKEKIKYVE